MLCTYMFIDQKLIGQGDYACVFKPSFECKPSPNTSDTDGKKS